ncbi:hypothetical protein HDU76_007971, partial [Blyttiomyces sp. JEL0837]
MPSTSSNSMASPSQQPTSYDNENNAQFIRLCDLLKRTSEELTTFNLAHITTCQPNLPSWILRENALHVRLVQTFCQAADGVIKQEMAAAAAAATATANGTPGPSTSASSSSSTTTTAPTAAAAAELPEQQRTVTSFFEPPSELPGGRRLKNKASQLSVMNAMNANRNARTTTTTTTTTTISGNEGSSSSSSSSRPIIEADEAIITTSATITDAPAETVEDEETQKYHHYIDRVYNSGIDYLGSGEMDINVRKGDRIKVAAVMEMDGQATVLGENLETGAQGTFSLFCLKYGTPLTLREEFLGQMESEKVKVALEVAQSAAEADVAVVLDDGTMVIDETNWNQAELSPLPFPNRMNRKTGLHVANSNYDSKSVLEANVTAGDEIYIMFWQDEEVAIGVHLKTQVESLFKGSMLKYVGDSANAGGAAAGGNNNNLLSVQGANGNDQATANTISFFPGAGNVVGNNTTGPASATVTAAPPVVAAGGNTTSEETEVDDPVTGLGASNPKDSWLAEVIVFQKGDARQYEKHLNRLGELSEDSSIPSTYPIMSRTSISVDASSEAAKRWDEKRPIRAPGAFVNVKNIITEIHASEQAFRSMLVKFNEFIILPLKDAEILGEKDFEIAFSRVRPLIEVSAEMEFQFGKLVEAGSTDLQELATIFLTHITDDAWKDYIHNFRSSKQVIATVAASDSKQGDALRKFNQNLAANPEIAPWTILDFMLLPLLRVTRFWLQLEKLKDANSTVFDDIDAAADSQKHVASILHSIQAKEDAMRAMYHIASKIDNFPGSISRE